MATTGSGDAHVDALSEMVDRLNVCIAQARLYGPLHTETRKAVVLLHTSVSQNTMYFGPIELKSSNDGFFWRGTQVSVEKDDRPGVARHLHIEGIQALRLDPGIDEIEIAKLLDVLRVNLSLPDYEEETLESLLYQSEFQHVGYRAVAALMEAESLSGRADQNLAEQERLLRQAIELDRRAEEIGSDLGSVLRGDRLGMSEQDARVWRIMQTMQIDENVNEDEAWRNSLSESESEDALLVQQLRSRIATERDSELLARSVGIALRSATANVPELPPAVGMKLASDAVRQIYALGDPVGLLRVVDDGHALAERLGSADPAMRDQVRKFLSGHVHPMRIARMLRSLDPSVAGERAALERFARILPEAALLALVGGTMRDEDRRAAQIFLKAIWVVSGPRMLALLQDPMRLGPDLLVPLLYLLNQVNAPEVPAVRRMLLQHSAAPVREASLQMFDQALPREEVQPVVALLLDRATSCRRSAADVLRRHRPPEAVPFLIGIVQAAEFQTLDRSIKVDVCVTLGRIGGIGGIGVLEALLGTRVGLMGSDTAETTVEAAAFGLAATKNPNAMRILERGARAWSGTLRSACVDALAAAERDT
jgi:hypothetical protein